MLVKTQNWFSDNHHGAPNKGLPISGREGRGCRCNGRQNDCISIESRCLSKNQIRFGEGGGGTILFHI